MPGRMQNIRAEMKISEFRVSFSIRVGIDDSDQVKAEIRANEANLQRWSGNTRHSSRATKMTLNLDTIKAAVA